MAAPPAAPPLNTLTNVPLATTNYLPSGSPTVSPVVPSPPPTSPIIPNTIATGISDSSSLHSITSSSLSASISSPSLQSPTLETSSASSPVNGVQSKSVSPSSASPSTSSATAAPNSSPLPPPPPHDSNTGLIAAAAVLGGLLAVAIVALIFLLIIMRRRSHTRRDYEPTMEVKDSPESTIRELKTTIIGLEKSIDDRDSKIRHAQATVLRNGHQSGDSGLGDAQIRDQFAALSQSINDWVVSYFRSVRFQAVLPPDVLNVLRKAVPEYQGLIEDPRTRYLVMRAVVAEIIIEAFANGDLVGNAAYSELRRLVDAHSFNDWNAKTVALLEKSPRYESDRASAVHNIVQKIDRLTSRLAGLEYSERRFNHLRAPLDAASKLALALAKEPAAYTLARDQPGAPFDPDTMEDALQDASGSALRGHRIRGNVFPAVKKSSAQEGTLVGQTTYVRKAQVIV